MSVISFHQALDQMPVTDTLTIGDLVSRVENSTESREINPEICILGLDFSKVVGEISDWSDLQNFESLIWVNLNGIQLQSFEFLEGIELTTLYISGNQAFNDWDFFRDFNLSVLDISNTTIDNLTHLSNSELNNLNISDNNISSLFGLNVSKLEELDVSNTQITDFTPLNYAGFLRELTISQDQGVHTGVLINKDIKLTINEDNVGG